MEAWRLPSGQKQTKSRHKHQSITETNKYNSLQQSHLIPGDESSKFDTWGHQIEDKDERYIRIAFRNINSLPQDKLHNKNDIFIQEIRESQADIYCVNEVNIAWHNIDQGHNLYERFKGKL